MNKIITVFILLAFISSLINVILCYDDHNFAGMVGWLNSCLWSLYAIYVRYLYAQSLQNRR